MMFYYKCFTDTSFQAAQCKQFGRIRQEFNWNRPDKASSEQWLQRFTLSCPSICREGDGAGKGNGQAHEWSMDIWDLPGLGAFGASLLWSGTLWRRRPPTGKDSTRAWLPKETGNSVFFHFSAFHRKFHFFCIRTRFWFPRSGCLYLEAVLGLLFTGICTVGLLLVCNGCECKDIGNDRRSHYHSDVAGPASSVRPDVDMNQSASWNSPDMAVRRTDRPVGTPPPVYSSKRNRQNGRTPRNHHSNPAFSQNERNSHLPQINFGPPQESQWIWFVLKITKNGSQFNYALHMYYSYMLLTCYNSNNLFVWKIKYFSPYSLGVKSLILIYLHTN